MQLVLAHNQHNLTLSPLLFWRVWPCIVSILYSRFTLDVFFFTKEFADVSKEAKSMSPPPVVVVQGTQTKVKAAFLVCEKVVLSKVDAVHIPLILFAAYYTFNIKYPSGCSNFFSFLEVLFLNAVPPKRAKLNHFLNMLEHTTPC